MKKLIMKTSVIKKIIKPNSIKAMTLSILLGVPALTLTACSSGDSDSSSSPKQDYQTTTSGLKYKALNKKVETGKSPVASDTVTVHYEGRFTDGKVFDSSYKGGKPSTFPLSRVIEGWTEGVQLMREGDKFEFYIPADLAYGANGRGTIPPNTPLVFTVELIKVH